MDRLNNYRNIIINFLKKHIGKPVNQPEIETQIVTDQENDHYFLYDVGWNGLERIHDCIFHIDIIQGKVWIHANNTDILIGEELVEKGIPKTDIVLGLQPPYKRKYTEYAVV